jgi:hypothetical protein
MKIVDVKTEDISTIKTIVDILHGFISEANAEFIRDVRSDEEIKNDNDNDIDDSDYDSDDSNDSDNCKSLKNKNPLVKNML